MIDTADRKIMALLNMAGATDQFETCVKMWEVAQGSLSESYFSRVWWQDNGWCYFDLQDGTKAVQGRVAGALGDVLFTFWQPDGAVPNIGGHGVGSVFKEKPQGRLALVWEDLNGTNMVCTVGGVFKVIIELSQGVFNAYVPGGETCPGSPFLSVGRAKFAVNKWLSDSLGGLVGNDQQ
jgi:hypothetical protein